MMSRRRTSTGSFSIASSIHFSLSSGSSMLLGPAAAGAAAGAAASDIGGGRPGDNSKEEAFLVRCEPSRCEGLEHLLLSLLLNS